MRRSPGLIAALASMALSSTLAERMADLSRLLAVREQPDRPARLIRRGKGKQAKPRKRPNMRHVAKRVKRKHRRAGS